MIDELLEIDLDLDYKNLNSPISETFPLINFMGNNLIGAQLMVWQGEDLLSLSHNCPNIKHIYGIDEHKPYRKKIFVPDEIIDKRSSKVCNFHTKNNIEFSCKKNITLIEKNIKEAHEEFKDKSLDFILMTIQTSGEDFRLCFDSWFNKIKKNGYIIGYNYDSNILQKELKKIKEDYLLSDLYTYKHLWIYKKIK